MEVLGAAALALLGLASVTLWVASHRSERVWRRNAAAFSGVVSPATAEGSVGGMLPLSVGLVSEGLGLLGFLLAEQRYGAGSTAEAYRFWVRAAFWSLVLLVVCFGASVTITLLRRPRWFFPHSVTQEVRAP
ncbi:hypothetical protein [Phycicoccus avicenniae]|uniref:hypothetical protein n=1 Tax=Phycicoccus avicenniae TaxID=2828860 RepID=UPI003D2DFED4